MQKQTIYKCADLINITCTYFKINNYMYLLFSCRKITSITCWAINIDCHEVNYKVVDVLSSELVFVMLLHS